MSRCHDYESCYWSFFGANGQLLLPPSCPRRPEEFAESVFFFRGEEAPDEVECSHCGVRISHWEANDTIPGEHRRFRPLCSLLESRNQLERTPVQCHDSSNESVVVASSVSPAELFVNSFFARLRTFDAWPSESLFPPHDLAKAGFIYIRRGDCVQCASCLLLLDGWETEDDPVGRHRQRSPGGCRFLNPRDAVPTAGVEHAPASTTMASPVEIPVAGPTSTRTQFSDRHVVSTRHTATFRGGGITGRRDIGSEPTLAGFPYRNERKCKFSDQRACCQICLERPPDTSLGCGHVGCSVCFEKVKLCPFCNNKIDKTRYPVILPDLTDIRFDYLTHEDVYAMCPCGHCICLDCWNVSLDFLKQVGCPICKRNVETFFKLYW